ncbi:aminoglycoside phosphotransferase family protein [Gammaproteobacteria bacterium]|nr:aminoglycoside phosphotransferase family protein [Gammaproteobacteria bacterium]
MKDKGEIEQYIRKLIDMPVELTLNENSSVLISSTRDKIIIHRHGQFFQKISLGNSYGKAKNEAFVYDLLNNQPKNFEVSKFFDYLDNDSGLCSFKLSSQRKNFKLDMNIASALVELFNVTRQNERPFSLYLEDLKHRYLKSTIDCESVEVLLINIINNHKDSFIPLGFVHRDFKPWNINDELGLLIFDFEEAVVDGPPLEDLFNYYIDPIVRYATPSRVLKNIFEKNKTSEYERYLKELKIKIDVKLLLYCYLVERAIFWVNLNDKETSQKYCDLFEYILMDYDKDRA